MRCTVRTDYSAARHLILQVLIGGRCKAEQRRRHFGLYSWISSPTNKTGLQRLDCAISDLPAAAIDRVS